MAALTNRTMKALKLTKTTDNKPVLSVEKVDIPTPRAGELLVKIHASAIQPADILNSEGLFPQTTFPRTIGKDFAGIVVAGSQQWQGQEVFGTSGSDFSFTVNGAQAEYAIVPDDAVVKKSTSLTFAQAACLGTPWSTAAVTLSRANICKGESVLVLGGTGSVGNAVMQIARFRGCQAVSVGRHGADVNSMSDPTLQSARELIGGRGPDIVVDTVGDFALTMAALEIMADNGRLSMITAPRSGDTHLPVDIFKLYRKQHSIIGCNTVAMTQTELAQLLSSISIGFDHGTLKAMDEKDLNPIGIDDAVGAYQTKLKRAVIVFDK